MSSTRQRGLVDHTDLGHFLELVYENYHDPRYLGTDPLVMVRDFECAADKEIGALFSALLAYGNVKQINASLQRLFDCMDNEPGRFVREFKWKAASRALRGFKHRFADENDILCLCLILHKALQKDTLESGFARGMKRGCIDLSDAAGSFVDYLQSMDTDPHYCRADMLSRSSFKHLMPRADKGSACKRIHLFLRWMIRPDDGIDLGLWKSISPELLLVPVDTHIMQLSQRLGLTTRRSASLQFSREVTAQLREVDRHDPVRFDFSLCRLGIMKVEHDGQGILQINPCQAYGFCKAPAKAKLRVRKPSGQ